MEQNIQTIKTAISKLVKLFIPDGITDIDFDITKNSGDWYSMRITYVVPDDSEFLTKKHYDNLSRYYSIWNEKIKKGLRNYLDIKAIVNQTGITSQSFYEKEKQWQAKN